MVTALYYRSATAAITRTLHMSHQMSVALRVSEKVGKSPCRAREVYANVGVFQQICTSSHT